MNKRLKRLLLFAGLLSLIVFLSACARSASQMEPITPESTGFWDGFVLYNFSRLILWISNLFNSYGMGIIGFTFLVRIILLPISIYQAKSTRKMQELSPELQALQEKYPGRDPESMEKLQEEQSRLYKKHGINPFSGILPLLIQMPILIALYQSIVRTPELTTGSFLWFELGEPDPYFILPILAALLMLANTYLMQMAQPKQAATQVTMWTMPILILLITISLPSAIALYFVASNAFSVLQTLVFNNPFKQIREKEEKAQAEAEEERRRERAIRKAYRSGRSTKK